MDYMLDHVLDHMLDYMIIGLIIMALQLPFSLAGALTNKWLSKSYLQLGKKTPNPMRESGGKLVLLWCKKPLSPIERIR